MPLTKTEEFRKADVRLARVAKALAHPARIAILRELAKRSECVCGEIVNVIPLAQSTVSQHLKELKNVGMIRGTIDGPRSCYCVDPDKMNELASLLEEFLESIKCTCTDTKCR